MHHQLCVPALLDPKHFTMEVSIKKRARDIITPNKFTNITLHDASRKFPEVALYLLPIKNIVRWPIK